MMNQKAVKLYASLLCFSESFQQPSWGLKEFRSVPILFNNDSQLRLNNKKPIKYPAARRKTTERKSSHLILSFNFEKTRVTADCCELGQVITLKRYLEGVDVNANPDWTINQTYDSKCKPEKVKSIDFKILSSEPAWLSCNSHNLTRLLNVFNTKFHSQRSFSKFESISIVVT